MASKRITKRRRVVKKNKSRRVKKVVRRSRRYRGGVVDKIDFSEYDSKSIDELNTEKEKIKKQIENILFEIDNPNMKQYDYSNVQLSTATDQNHETIKQFENLIEYIDKLIQTKNIKI